MCGSLLLAAAGQYNICFLFHCKQMEATQDGIRIITLGELNQVQ